MASMLASLKALPVEVSNRIFAHLSASDLPNLLTALDGEPELQQQASMVVTGSYCHYMKKKYGYLLEKSVPVEGVRRLEIVFEREKVEIREEAMDSLMELYPNMSRDIAWIRPDLPQTELYKYHNIRSLHLNLLKINFFVPFNGLVKQILNGVGESRGLTQLRKLIIAIRTTPTTRPPGDNMQQRTIDRINDAIGIPARLTRINARGNTTWFWTAPQGEVLRWTEKETTDEMLLIMEGMMIQDVRSMRDFGMFIVQKSMIM